MRIPSIPIDIQFATIVRHLSGEARKLVLNLPADNQNPSKALEELFFQHGEDSLTSDPLASFYERTQRPFESLSSYAVQLEALLRTVEDVSNHGHPLPDRDMRLTMQFMRGLQDEGDRQRLAPMKPREMKFCDLRAELKQIEREKKMRAAQHQTIHVSKNNQKQETQKKTDSKPSDDSKLDKLLELVEGLSVAQADHSQRLAQLETKVTQISEAQSQRHRRRPVTCFKCQQEGHISRNCQNGPQQANNTNASGQQLNS